MGGPNGMPVKIERREERKMVTFRLPLSLIRALGETAKAEGLEKTQFLEACLKAGLDDYRRNGLIAETLQAVASK